ncbi:MAG TPA: hypothetical protein VM513_23975 [Kofleriaceae bacterium]|nr:hypothetical protein [Kofleriaceae bacterium]
MPYRTQEQLPELLAALAPKLAPLELSLRGDVLRIRDPRRADRYTLVASGLLVGVPAALVGVVVSWFIPSSWWQAAGLGFALGGLVGAVYEAIVNRPWTVEIDRTTRAVRRTGPVGFADRCGPDDRIALRPQGLGKLDEATGFRAKVVARVLLEQPDGDRRHLLGLVRDGTDVTDARRIAAALAAWLDLVLVEERLKPDGSWLLRGTSPPQTLPSGKRGAPPGLDAINEHQERLGLAPIAHEATVGDMIRTSLDILDLLS